MPARRDVFSVTPSLKLHWEQRRHTYTLAGVSGSGATPDLLWRKNSLSLLHAAYACFPLAHIWRKCG